MEKYFKGEDKSLRGEEQVPAGRLRTEAEHDRAEERIELLEGIRNYEMVRGYEQHALAFRDFADICAEGGSVAGTILQKCARGIHGDVTEESLNNIKKEIEAELLEYDKTDNYPFSRVTSLDFQINQEKMIVEYGTCNGTRIALSLETKGQGAQIEVGGAASSVVRRICAIDAPTQFHRKEGKEVLPEIVTDTLPVIEENNNILRDTNVCGSMRSPLQLKVTFDPDMIDGVSSGHAVSVSVDYHAFYGYTDRLDDVFPGFMEHTTRGRYWEFPGIIITQGESISDRVAEYVDLISRITKRVEEIRLGESDPYYS